ncbi:MAG: hypothetical protein JXQ75_06515 [Phycisphaerae bacterium]|nr:hypothetical protein [Phycisphaerae bacterium]
MGWIGFGIHISFDILDGPWRARCLGTGRERSTAVPTVLPRHGSDGMTPDPTGVSCQGTFINAVRDVRRTIHSILHPAGREVIRGQAPGETRCRG